MFKKFRKNMINKEKILFSIMSKIGDDFKTLSLKDLIAYTTAILAFLAGWGVTIAGFMIPPVGDITDSVLWVLG